jgi:hypothetical protein
VNGGMIPPVGRECMSDHPGHDRACSVIRLASNRGCNLPGVNSPNRGRKAPTLPGRMMSIVQKILDRRLARTDAPACRPASAEGWR